MPDGQGVKGVPLPAGVAQLHQPFGNRAGSKTLVSVEIKDDADDLRFLLIDGQNAVLFIVAIELVVAQHMTVFDGLPKAKFQPFRQLPDFILSNTRHNHQPELAVRVQCVDIVVLKEHPHVVIQQFLRISDAVQSRSGKTGNLLGDDGIEHSGLGIPNHSVKIVPLLRGATGNSLIHIPRHEFPVGLALNQLRVILHLIFQGIDLLVLVCGYPGIKGHPEGQVVKGPAHAHFSTNFPYFHIHPPFQPHYPRRKVESPRCQESFHGICRKPSLKSSPCPKASAIKHPERPTVPHSSALTSKHHMSTPASSFRSPLSLALIFGEQLQNRLLHLGCAVAFRKEFSKVVNLEADFFLLVGLFLPDDGGNIL